MTNGMGGNAPEPPDLPESFAQGDAPAFERLFSGYFDPLCRFVVSYVRSSEIAKELVDDAFLRLWLHVPRSGCVENVRAFLYATARNLAIDHLRRQRREVHHLEHRVGPVLRARGEGAPAEAEHELVTRELVAAIHRAVDALAPQQREVVLRKWQRQATHEEIARELGIAPKTVAEHFRRAIEHLRRLLPESLADLP